jgi:hypothetical protein
MPPKGHLCMRLWVLTGCFKLEPKPEPRIVPDGRAIPGGCGNTLGDWRWRSVSVWRSSASCPRSFTLSALDSGVASAASAKLCDSKAA